MQKFYIGAVALQLALILSHIQPKCPYKRWDNFLIPFLPLLPVTLPFAIYNDKKAKNITKTENFHDNKRGF